MIVNILQISVCVYIYISNEERPGPFVLVIQSCPTLCDPMDYSSPGSSVHGDYPGKNTGVGCHALLSRECS